MWQMSIPSGSNSLATCMVCRRSARYLTWEEALSGEIFADAVVNSTPDRIHYASTMKALDRGYHVLLEKPMASP